ncbi:hypothetical protein LCGC14_1154870 [marine sediment metagenome]|uniref:Uncharacterized protein n=2 Tax=marine sediment metagenome TaxID=412755 RepID=A0A0F9MHH7_9ZZZZ
MTQEKSLVVGEAIPLAPAAVVENAATQAKLLMSIVEQTKCYQTISGKKYLQVEAWETIGAFNNVHAETQMVTPITRDGEVVGYEATVKLIKNGASAGGATMPCFFTENACKGKEGDAKHKACMSAAQTFATSKAYRMNYSYVAILGGFQPTPAEEMGATTEGDTPNKNEHWCEKHQTNFFKKGKMKGFAHKIEGTDEWCNEEEPQSSPDAPQQVSSPAKKGSSSEPLIDKDRCVEQIKMLGEDDPDWSREVILKRLNKLSGKDATSITHAISLLDEEQGAFFVKGIEVALKVKGG